MLELFFMYRLGVVIRKRVTERGQTPLPYLIFMVMLWIGLEIVGARLGTYYFKENLLMMFVCAITGGAIGGFLSYQAAKHI